MSKRNSCPGFCCMAFTLQYSPSALARLPVKRFGPDVSTIKEMVIYLGKRLANPVVEQSNLDGVTKKSHFYTCKHFDAVTRSCLDYANRPKMCSNFPNDQKACPYVGCGHYNGRERRRLKMLREERKTDDRELTLGPHNITKPKMDKEATP